MGERKAKARAEGKRAPSTIESVLDTALDKAISVQRPVVLAYLGRAQSKRPDASPAAVVESMERRYLATVVGIGGASGAAAALPGAGTLATVASSAAEITAFVTATATFVLALAELHSIPVSDPEVRRALVVAVLLGESGAAALEVGEVESKHWAQALAQGMTADRMRTVNTHLGQLLLARFGARQGTMLLGRALPLGIGAGIGALGNAALARSAIAASRRAFGDPPEKFPPRVVDA